MSDATSPIWIVGAGAVGGYIAAHLAQAGRSVHVIDGWDAHIEAIAARGLTVEEPSGRTRARVGASRIGVAAPAPFPQAVVLACKIRATSAILDWLEDRLGYRGLYIATLNGLADAEVARRIGAKRVLGCVVAGLHGELRAPGLIVRHAARWGANPVFRLGEILGPVSERARAWAETFAAVDRSVAIDDLVAERWTKLQYNAMTSALSAIAGVPVRDLCLNAAPRERMIAIGLEVVAVARVKGIGLGTVCGVAPEIWQGAAAGDAAARGLVENGVEAYGRELSPTARSGSARDRARGRASEVDELNGAVVRQAAALGLETPENSRLRDELIAIEKAAGSR